MFITYSFVLGRDDGCGVMLMHMLLCRRPGRALWHAWAHISQIPSATTSPPTSATAPSHLQ